MTQRARQTNLGRLGLVLYWVGCIIALLIFGFGVFGSFAERTFFWAGISIPVAIISYGIGRAALFILGNL